MVQLVEPLCSARSLNEAFFEQKNFNFRFKPPSPLAKSWLRACAQLTLFKKKKKNSSNIEPRICFFTKHPRTTQITPTNTYGIIALSNSGLTDLINPPSNKIAKPQAYFMLS